MTVLGRFAFSLLVMLAVLAAWRVVVITWADREAAVAPDQVLRLAPGHPGALLALAEQHLAGGELAQARTYARRLLESEPLQWRGFDVLAQAAERSGQPTYALALYRIAVRRDPRDLAGRIRLEQAALGRGDFHEAALQLDMVLRTRQDGGAALMPGLVQLARQPALAIELAVALRSQPRWRSGFLNALCRGGDPVALDQVMSRLQQSGDLAPAEMNNWIEALIVQGRWGAAYSRWASDPVIKGHPLLPVYNGSFAWPPAHRGFDWRARRLPGVTLDFTRLQDGHGAAAHWVFAGRPVASGGLEQALLLAPGRYRLSASMRAELLRSAEGLELVIACNGHEASPIAMSERIDGSFAWSRRIVDFSVPAEGCDGQWLRLRNPAPPGLSQVTAGQLWLDDVEVTPAAPM